LHGAPGARRSAAPGASEGFLIFALVAGTLLLFVALFRYALGAPASAGFWTIFLTPLLVAARFAGQSAPVSALWLATGALILCAPLCVLAVVQNRKMPDALFSAALAFQLFFFARVFNSFLSSAGAPTWAALSRPQKINLVMGVLLLGALWLAWIFKPKPPTPYESSAPSRIKKFLRKRRLPSRILGGALMAFAIIAILLSARAAFWGGSTLLSPTRAVWVFLVCDAIYFAGKKFWRRLS